MKTQQRTFVQVMDQLTRRYGVSAVFSDLLFMMVCTFSHGQMEKEYLETIGRYDKKEIPLFPEAFAALVIEMTGAGEGMIDVLGDYFEQHISHGHNGQFFTPQPICDMMARMQNPPRALDRIHDPACGSGRMLMAMAKLNRWARFYGADNDRNCALMTVVNMTLNAMYGEVAWMNSLSQQWYGGWVIEPTIHCCPRVTPITEQQSYIKLPLPATASKISPPASISSIVPQPGGTSEAEGVHTLPLKSGSQLVFDF
jgi:hypothetical protein